MPARIRGRNRTTTTEDPHMGLFDLIKEKLGIGRDAHATERPAGAPPSGTTTAAGGTTADPSVTPPTPGAGAAPMSQVDVAAKLESMAASHGEQLNWRTSIVDLVKLLGLDSSLEARRNLANELGCPPDRFAETTKPRSGRGFCFSGEQRLGVVQVLVHQPLAVGQRGMLGLFQLRHHRPVVRQRQTPGAAPVRRGDAAAGGPGQRAVLVLQ